MSWNYRVVQHGESKDSHFAVHEVFYDESGNITHWTADPINITGEDLDEVKDVVVQIAKDISLPVLLASELPQ